MDQTYKETFRLTNEGQSVWSQNDRNIPVWKRPLLQLVRIFFIVSRAPFNKKILTQASALSFTFILSLIPVLAMIFSIAKGFGIQDRVQPLLLQKAVGGEIASDLIPKIIEYVNNTNVAALGSIGLVFIIYTTISMLGQIEGSFNQIWFIDKPRTLVRKASDYLSIMVIGPIFLAVTMGLPTTLHSNAMTQKLMSIGLFAGAFKLFFFFLPWLSSILILTLVFIIIPNTRVRFLPAFFSAILAGSLWQLTQFLFIEFQIGVARYNAIYGTFASVPIFMIWLQVSWMIVLFGGVLSFAFQNVKKFHPLEYEKNISYAGKEKLSLAVLLSICWNFDKGKGPVSPSEISDQLGISDNFVLAGIARLLKVGKILPVSEGDSERYVPFMPGSEIKISEFLSDIKVPQTGGLEFKDARINETIHEILTRNQKALNRNLGEHGMNEHPWENEEGD
ncbi:MAG: YihY/virulence factor BrkB family protein [Desulfobulbaceae bacterium]|nr:YihY/virulence factor BrkB family protein [Desulfobulbaceae bacterium]